MPSFALMLAACAAVPAKYAGWEPMNANVPQVSSSLALRRLQQSRAIWQHWRAQHFDSRASGRAPTHPEGKYSYLRAHQISENRVDFTVFVVATEQESERVTLRALVSADPRELPSIYGKAKRLASQWVERDGEVGQHEGAALPRTIDALYGDCARSIEAHPGIPVRLFFHPNGVLMQCGFAAADCSNCGEVSVQSFSHFPVDEEIPALDPAKWLCATGFGLFAPGSEVELLGGDTFCYAPFGGRPVAPKSGDPSDVCSVEPSACVLQDEGIAHWARGRGVCARYPGHVPDALEVGKINPLAIWGFDFHQAGEIDCGDD